MVSELLNMGVKVILTVNMMLGLNFKSGWSKSKNAPTTLFRKGKIGK